MRNIVIASAMIFVVGLGALTVSAQEQASPVGDASAAFAQIRWDMQGTAMQDIMHAPAGDVIAVYVGRAPRQMYSKQDELFYVISGHGTAAVGYPVYDLKPGSVLSIPRQTAFEITSSGNAPIKAILIASPHNDPNDKQVLH